LPGMRSLLLALFVLASAATGAQPRGDIFVVFDGWKEMRGDAREWDAGSADRSEPPDAMLCFDVGGGATSGGCNEAEARALCQNRYACRFADVPLPPGLGAIHLLDRDARAHDHAGALTDAASLAGFPNTCRVWAPCRIERGWLIFSPSEPAARCEAGPGNTSPVQRAASAMLVALGAPEGRVSAEAVLFADGMFGALDLSPFAWALARDMATGGDPDLSPTTLREQMLRSRLVSRTERVRTALSLPPERLFASPAGAALLASLNPLSCAALAR